MKRLAIFAGYDKDKIIDDYVIYYLEKLKQVSDIIFVYDNRFPHSELKKVQKLTIHQICKKHGEYDFGSYKRGYLWAQKEGILKDYDSLIFCNDSVYGPFQDLQPIFNRFDLDENIDFWGIFLSLSKTGNTHIQSYFTVFKRRVYLNKVFSSFISSIEKKENKKAIIKDFEVGLSKCLQKNEFCLGSLFAGHHNEPHGKQIFKLIEKGFPFIKRSIFDITSGAEGIKNGYRYAEVITSASNYNPKLIEKNLKRVVNKVSLNSALHKRWNSISYSFVNKHFFKLTAKYTKNGKYRVFIYLFSIKIFKAFLPRCWGIKNGQ
jgi:lipopolysaccharide biosynthesis protein